jgi:ATPase subunit of ABC transporter with duplicated ATPase domains
MARAWVTEPDILLLDEPTNHLDLEKLVLLEEWINTTARQIPVVIASHDRDFLDACTTKTLFLRPEASVIFNHPYRRARALLDEHDAAEEAQQDKTLREARRLRQSANELRNIGINSGRSGLSIRSAPARSASPIAAPMLASSFPWKMWLSTSPMADVSS